MRRSKVRRTQGRSPGSDGRSPRRSPPSGCQEQPEASARSRCPTRRRAVGTMAPTGLLLLRRQPRISFNPMGGSGGKPILRGRDGRDVGMTGLHVQPRLAVGDVSARQAADPSGDEESDAAPNRSDRQTRPPRLGKTRRRGWADFSRATPSLRHPIPRAFLILIVAQFSP